MEYTKVAVTAGDISDWESAFMGIVPARHTVEVKLEFRVDNPSDVHWEIADAVQRVTVFNGTLMVKIPGDKNKSVEDVRAEAVAFTKTLLNSSLVNN
ncbi:hypothetical protein [Entomomonas asaccharolytica]|uniref:Uncharacterized protein n=1 Tax=Entomomonas asaccharolytica TaxID=2785331 RepID=A0A974RVW9_9GAMM|nr:hypothetical protein [Entomomonas asaccharolytica]QQP84472.1 hypothetical protein JHT90_08550 [Entomomonas asaccharolytica]